MIQINMRRPVRIIPFLILNIIVSAATVLIVLNWWSSTRPPTPLPQVIFPAENTPSAALPLPTEVALSAGGSLLQVVDVIGAGDVKNEAVQLKNNGEGEVRLSGWRMEDDQGHRYTFPNYVLGKGGGVRIFTRAGVDSATELFWGLSDPAWQSGKSVAIYDTQGNLRVSYKVP